MGLQRFGNAGWLIEIIPQSIRAKQEVFAGFELYGGEMEFWRMAPWARSNCVLASSSTLDM